MVARKAPAEWRDDDRERFRRELPQRLAAFARLVALHAEHRADGGGPFDALRVTVTRADGGEYVRLVGVDQRQRAELDAVLDGALDRLADLTGSTQRAGHTMLALLGERFLSETGAGTLPAGDDIAAGPHPPGTAQTATASAPPARPGLLAAGVRHG